MAGAGHRKNNNRDERYYRNGAYYANRSYSGRGRTYYGNNYNPGNNYYIVNDHHEKAVTPNIKRIIRTKNMEASR
jgi:hypothetical protein